MRRGEKNNDHGWKRLHAIVRAADPDEWRNRFRQAWESGDEKELKVSLDKLVASAKVDELLPESIVLLALALRDTGHVEQAIAFLRTAQRRHCGNFWINQELAFMLANSSPPRYEEAIRYYWASLAIRPDYAISRVDLGVAFARKGEQDEAITYYREAIRLKPDYADAYCSIGVALLKQRKLSQAEAAYRKAIVVDPSMAYAHQSLGFVLFLQKKLPQAEAAFRKAIEVDPNYAVAHNYLGFALVSQQRFREAITAARKAVDLDPFDVDIRYDATCVAALAACAQGKDAAHLEPEECASFRAQALAWLRADLSAYNSMVAKEPGKVLQRMRRWLQDPDFSGVRGADALTKLPEAERQEWQKLWQDVDELTKQTAPRGFVQAWLVLSELVPYEGTDGAKALGQQQVPGEALLRPRAGDKVEVSGKTLLWKEHHSAELYIDFPALYRSPLEHRVAYAICYVYANTDRTDLALRVGSDDQALLYVYGEEVYRQTKARALKHDEDEIRPIALRKGINVLVFKVVNQSGPGPYGCLRIVTKDGMPPDGIEYRVAP